VNGVSLIGIINEEQLPVSILSETGLPQDAAINLTVTDDTDKSIFFYQKDRPAGMVANLDVPAHLHAGGRSHQYVILQVFDFCIVVAVLDPCSFSIEAGGDGLVIPIQCHPEMAFAI
jgi:hypothetical protein